MSVDCMAKCDATHDVIERLSVPDLVSAQHRQRTDGEVNVLTNDTTSIVEI